MIKKTVTEEYDHKNGLVNTKDEFSFTIKVVDRKLVSTKIDHFNSISLNGLELLANDLDELVQRIKADHDKR